MNLVAKVKGGAQFEKHLDPKIRTLPGAVVRILPETAVKTIIGTRIDVVPEDMRFNEPQSLLVHHLEMDDNTQTALNQALSKYL
jgi:hypothetical protein